MSIDAMKEALEVLEEISDEVFVDDAITALRAAIEQAQEPIAWVGPSWMNPKTRWQNDAFSSSEIAGWIPLYTAPSREKNS